MMGCSIVCVSTHLQEELGTILAQKHAIDSMVLF